MVHQKGSSVSLVGVLYKMSETFIVARQCTARLISIFILEYIYICVLGLGTKFGTCACTTDSTSSVNTFSNQYNLCVCVRACRCVYLSRFGFYSFFLFCRPQQLATEFEGSADVA